MHKMLCKADDSMKSGRNIEIALCLWVLLKTPQYVKSPRVKTHAGHITTKEYEIRYGNRQTDAAQDKNPSDKAPAWWYIPVSECYLVQLTFGIS